MRKQTFTIENDQDQTTLGRALRQMREDSNLPLQVVVSEQRRRFTWNQSAALFAHAYPIICKATGNEINDIHDFCCRSYFGETTQIVFGKTVTRPTRTTTTDEYGEHNPISTKDFAQFFTSVQDMAAMQDIVIPDPDPKWKLKLQQQMEEEEKKDESTTTEHNVQTNELERSG